MGFEMGRINHDPFGLASLACEFRKNAIEHSQPAPTDKAVINSLVRAVQQPWLRSMWSKVTSLSPPFAGLSWIFSSGLTNGYSKVSGLPLMRAPETRQRR